MEGMHARLRSSDLYEAQEAIGTFGVEQARMHAHRHAYAGMRMQACICRQAGRQAGRHIQACMQAGRRAGGQAYSHVHIHAYIHVWRPARVGSSSHAALILTDTLTPSP